MRIPRHHQRSAPPCATLPSPFPPPDVGGLTRGGMQFGEMEYQTSAWPLRVMVFIDGSWLYYSFHGRRPNCPVSQRYGERWAYSNTVAFERLPYLISQHLHEQLLRSHGVSRFVEVASPATRHTLLTPRVVPDRVKSCRLLPELLGA
eukprot:scaffold64754_cov33-Tisochrysis_lutea.AAC.7